MDIDNKDRQMLQLLQADARHTVKELAQAVNLTPSPTFDRQKKMERDGVIKGYVALVDAKKVGNGLLALTSVKLREQTRECALRFMEHIKNCDEVTECHNVSGEYDFFLKIYLRDMEHYERFVFNKLGAIPSVGSYNTIFSIKEVKNTPAVPVVFNDDGEAQAYVPDYII